MEETYKTLMTMTVGVPVVTPLGGIEYMKVFSSFTEGYNMPVGLRKWMVDNFNKMISEISEKLSQ